MTSDFVIIGLLPDEKSFEYRSSTNNFNDVKVFFAEKLKVPVHHLQIFHKAHEVWNQDDFDIISKGTRFIKVHLRDRGRPTKVKGYNFANVSQYSLSIYPTRF